jgi:hypothetical protein
LQSQWDCQRKRLGGFEVYNEFKLGRLHDWQVGRLLALENAAGVDTGLAIGSSGSEQVNEQGSLRLPLQSGSGSRRGPTEGDRSVLVVPARKISLDCRKIYTFRFRYVGANVKAIRSDPADLCTGSIVGRDL